MGHRRVTVLNLRVERVDPDRNLLMVRGAIPGPRGSLVLVREAVRARQQPARKEAR
jgi:large subunit ribosomal protein L3